MKRDLPPYWTTQLAAIIILFSVGTALFPIGLLTYRALPSHPYWQRNYTYEGSFDANLTAATPIANVSVGNCDRIEVSDSRWDHAVPVTLRVYNDTHYLFGVLPSFGGKPTWSQAMVDLQLAVVQNYTVQVEREAGDTFFRCYIYAYENSPPPPVAPILTFPYSYFSIGAFLILFGLVLTSNFARRTRTFYQMA